MQKYNREHELEIKLNEEKTRQQMQKQHNGK